MSNEQGCFVNRLKFYFYRKSGNPHQRMHDVGSLILCRAPSAFLNWAGNWHKWRRLAGDGRTNGRIRGTINYRPNVTRGYQQSAASNRVFWPTGDRDVYGRFRPASRPGYGEIRRQWMAVGVTWPTPCRGAGRRARWVVLMTLCNVT